MRIRIVWRICSRFSCCHAMLSRKRCKQRFVFISFTVTVIVTVVIVVIISNYQDFLQPLKTLQLVVASQFYLHPSIITLVSKANSPNRLSSQFLRHQRHVPNNRLQENKRIKKHWLKYLPFKVNFNLYLHHSRKVEGSSLAQFHLKLIQEEFTEVKGRGLMCNKLILNYNE